MPTQTSPNNLANEQVTFIQHDLPGLDDGEYQLEVSQQVNDADGNPISDDTLNNTYRFAVTGDRFSLSNPGQTLYSVYPAPNASGQFSNVLPHVVFTKTTLPWSRYPTSSPPVTGLQPGGDTDQDVPTWMTILVLDEDDLEAYPQLKLSPVNATTADLFPQSLINASTLGDNYSYFFDSQNTQLNAGQNLSDVIQILDIPLPLFWKIAPTLEDLKLMAHVRQVSLIDKPTMPGISDVGEPLGKFSIVFGNRLPQTQKKAYAYLVSLEELEPFLPDSEEGGPPSESEFQASKFLRLAVLKSWTYYSTGQSATFVDQLLRLNGRDPESSTDAINTNLRLPYTGTNTVVENALKMGYTPLNENLRTAEKTVSWYRGPLIPYNISTRGIDLPIASPDKATIFDPTTGMFDLSYASAWSIGRLVALQDKSFSTALYNWKKGLTQSVIQSMEEEMINQNFQSFLQAETDSKLRLRATESNKPSAQLLHQMIRTLSENKK